MDNKLKEAEKKWPVLLPTPQGIDNFYIYVEGNNQAKYIPGRLQMLMEYQKIIWLFVSKKPLTRNGIQTN